VVHGDEFRKLGVACHGPRQSRRLHRSATTSSGKQTRHEQGRGQSPSWGACRTEWEEHAQDRGMTPVEFWGWTHDKSLPPTNKQQRLRDSYFYGPESRV
jgi:hypothetical protein